MNKNVIALLSTRKLRQINWKIVKRVSLVVVAIVIILGLYFELPTQIENYDATHLYHNRIFAQIKQLGGSEICNSGNIGNEDVGYFHGQTYNDWYEAFYWLPNRADLTTQVEALAASDGYHLAYDAATVNILNTPINPKDPATFPSTTYSRSSSYLFGHKDASTLSIILSRQADVALECGPKWFGATQGTGNRVIADVTVYDNWK